MWSTGWIANGHEEILGLNIHDFDCGGGFSDEYISLNQSTCAFSICAVYCTPAIPHFFKKRDRSSSKTRCLKYTRRDNSYYH